MVLQTKPGSLHARHFPDKATFQPWGFGSFWSRVTKYCILEHKWSLVLFFFLVFFLWGRASHTPGWPQTHLNLWSFYLHLMKAGTTNTCHHPSWVILDSVKFTIDINHHGPASFLFFFDKVSLSWTGLELAELHLPLHVLGYPTLSLFCAPQLIAILTWPWTARGKEKR